LISLHFGLDVHEYNSPIFFSRVVSEKKGAFKIVYFLIIKKYQIKEHELDMKNGVEKYIYKLD
jgi:hypothetical protein